MTAQSTPNRPPRGRHALVDAGLDQRRHGQRPAGSFVKITPHLLAPLVPQSTGIAPGQLGHR
jgi:hypothetical protein